MTKSFPGSIAADETRRVFWIGVVLISVCALWLLSNVLLLTFLALLLAVVLRGAADYIAHRTRLPSQGVIALIVIALILAAVGITYWIAPKLLQQAHDLASTLMQQAHHLRVRLDNTSWGKPLAHDLTGAEISSQHILVPAETAALITFSVLAECIVVVVTTLYLASAPEGYVAGALKLLPISYRPRGREVMAELTRTLRLWFLGQLIDMLTVGVLAAVGLSIAHVPVPYALAVIAGVLTFIPYFGAILAAIPAMMIALSVGWSTTLWVVAIYLLCHAIEGYVVAPLVQKRMIEMPPAITILSMTVMGVLFGPLGIVVGTPVAAAVIVLVREIYVHDLLGDGQKEDVLF